MSSSPFALNSDTAQRCAEAHVQHLIAWKQADPGVRSADTPIHRVRCVGIVGAGIMGTAIAAACVARRLAVVLTDSDPEAVDDAARRIAAELLASGQSTDAEDLVRQHVRATADPVAVATCDLVLESILETVPAKQAVYGLLQPHLGPRTILVSNTSTIPIHRLASGVSAPERFCGIHFFHPVRQRPLVEVIRGPLSSDETIAAAVTFGKQIHKTPLVVDDGPGFLVNRLLVPYLNEALELLLDGVPVDRIEHVAVQFGMAKGPLRLMDEIGLDTTLLGGRVLWEAFPERVVPSPLLISMVKSGLLGCKSGQGFFAYPDANPQTPRRQTLEALLATWRRDPVPLSDDLIAARLLLPMVLEASRLLQEGVVRSPGDIDLAVLLGLGFPSARGGILYWADSFGAGKLLDLLCPLQPLGARMAPTDLLVAMADQNRHFYD